MRTTKIIINPKFRHLESFIKSLPETFETSGEVIYNGRNQIRLYERNEVKIAVKRYKIPLLVSRVHYTLFRPSKAKRAYEYAVALEKMGFDTPAPIAYIEISNNGIFERGYFASEMVDAKVVRFWEEENPEELKQLLAEFAAYTARLHDNGILHLDYSPGNILYRKENGHFRFYLIDINRMRFNITDRDLLMRNFERITPNPDILRSLAREYALVNGTDIERTVEKAFEAVAHFEHKQLKKNRLKRIFK